VGVNLGPNYPIMALSCGGPSFSLSADFLLEEVRPRLQGIVQRLKESMGQV